MTESETQDQKFLKENDILTSQDKLLKKQLCLNVIWNIITVLGFKDSFIYFDKSEPTQGGI